MVQSVQSAPFLSIFGFVKVSPWRVSVAGVSSGLCVGIVMRFWLMTMVLSRSSASKMMFWLKVICPIVVRSSVAFGTFLMFRAAAKSVVDPSNVA